MSSEEYRVKLKSAFKHLSQASVLALFFCTSCGLLGNKDAKDKTTRLNQDTGCLDQLGAILKLYLHGNITAEEWTGTWTCVDDTLDTFTKYVQGSVQDAYTKEDVQLLVSRFIITSKPITPEFIDGLFALKATIFGGSDSLLTKSEVTEFRRIASFVKNRSVSLIPMLWNYRQAKTRANLDQFATALRDFATAFANELRIEGHSPLAKQKVVTFLRELGKTSIEIDPEELGEWADLFFSAKVFLLRGDSSALSAAELVELVKMTGDLGSQAITLASNEPGSDTPAQLRAIDVLQRQLLTSFARWSGKVPFEVLEDIIDVIPKSWLPTRADEFKNGLVTLLRPRVEVAEDGTKSSVPSMVSQILMNKGEGKDGFLFDQNVNEILDEVRLFAQAERTLDQVYAKSDEELSGNDFSARVKALSSEGKLDYPGSAEVNRLIKLARTFKGVFDQGSNVMRFDGRVNHSHTSLTRLNWMERVVRRLLEAYGSAKDSAGEPLGDLGDLQRLVKDVNPLLEAMSLVHPEAINVHKKRFREANLFMSVSNGDANLDIDEVTEYLNTLVASSAFGNDIIEAFFRPRDGGKTAALCDTVGWDDKVHVPTYDLECWRREFPARFTQTFHNFPELASRVSRATTGEKGDFFRQLEAATRVDGVNENPLSEFDISSYAGIAHYVDSVMHRFDLDKDGTLNRAETMAGVFPVFQRELASLMEKVKITAAHQALLLYLMQKGRSPFACDSSPTFGEIANLSGWVLGGGLGRDFKADRVRVYAIFGTLSAAGLGCGKSSSSAVSASSVRAPASSLNDLPFVENPEDTALRERMLEEVLELLPPAL